ncbi:MAG TPA: hypothetical protein VD766_13915 [Solirubrobacterales bacterium]|nr:hypothetical protein [Solirubrobacterales bacterium]
MAYRVYVVELEHGAGPRRDPRIPWVYVGSSARDPELRLAQHKRGYRSSGLVKRFAVRLRPDLYEDLEPLKTSRLGVEAEAERARELAACGFVAHSDGTSWGEGSGTWQEWDVDRLRPIARHVEAAVHDLTEAAFERLEPSECARLLHGERGFWVERYLDPGDPPPAYGLFPHVQLSALERVARANVRPGDQP